MGRIYAIPFSGTASGETDLLEIRAAEGKLCRVHNIVVSQTSDAGDSESEQVSFFLYRTGSGATSGSGGSSASVNAMDPSDTAFGGSAEQMNTTIISGGTPVLLYMEAVNVMAGFNWFPTPETRAKWNDQQYLALRIEAPGDDLSIQGVAIIEEEG